MMAADKNIHIRLSYDEILYDIKNNAYVQADMMKTDDEHDKHQVFDIGEDGNIDRVSRTMDLAFKECVSFLYPYTKEKVEDESDSDDTLDSPIVYEIAMTVPDGFAKGTQELLTDYIHEYMVCRVLEDWMDITYPKVADMWKAKRKEMEEKIHYCKNHRNRRARRTQSPF